jgi:hypothetical protein
MCYQLLSPCSLHSPWATTFCSLALPGPHPLKGSNWVRLTGALAPSGGVGMEEGSTVKEPLVHDSSAA